MITQNPIHSGDPEKYRPAHKRHGIALCLSGGGYRAALFQLGAARRLNELGILGKLDSISSVSGGSIFAAWLALHIGSMSGGKFADFENDLAKPFRKFTTNDIRTSPALRRLLPWEWANAAAQSEGLQEKYDTLLTNHKFLRDLPTRPQFHFCATDLAFGVNWAFTRDKVGDYQAGYMEKDPSGAILLAQAVAASSCFPPVFKPMPMNLTPGDLPILGKAPNSPQRNELIGQLALTDGGVYDNMGLEPVWKDCQTLLVCDGGKPFRFAKESDTPHQLLRINDVMGDQAEAVRKRWLIANFLDKVYDGAYWGIGSAVSDYATTNVPGYTNALVKESISTIRTDMDKFSDDEAAVLENHGYLLTEAALKAYVPSLYSPLPLIPGPTLWPDAPQLAVVEQNVRKALADSSHIHIFGH